MDTVDGRSTWVFPRFMIMLIARDLDILIELFYSWRPYKFILAVPREKYGVRKR